MKDQRSPRGAVTSLYFEDIEPGAVLNRGKTVMEARGLFARREVAGSPESGR